MKKCKPNYRMNHFPGCGKPKPIFKYGSCQQCFIKWTLSTEEGKEWLAKQTAWKMRQNQKENDREQRKKDKEMRIQLMSTSEYWSKVFQPRINQIIKIIDKGNGCIVSNSPLGKQNAGHYYSVGSNKTLSLHLHNIHLQSEQSNSFRGGQPIEYLEGIKRVYGENYANYVVGLKRCPSLNITKIELIEIYPIVLEIRKELLKQELFGLSPMKRIDLRNEASQRIGLYPEKFIIYDSKVVY